MEQPCEEAGSEGVLMLQASRARGGRQAGRRAPLKGWLQRLPSRAVRTHVQLTAMLSGVDLLPTSPITEGTSTAMRYQADKN